MISVPLGRPTNVLLSWDRPPISSTGRSRARVRPFPPHRCIRSRLPSGRTYRWEFQRHGEAPAIDGEGPLILDEPNLMPAAAPVGFGFASEWNVAAERGGPSN